VPPHENNTEATETMTDLQTHAEDIVAQFSDHLDLTVDDVEERLGNLVNEYQVPVDEARRSVVNSYLDEAGLDRDALGGGDNASVGLAEIDQDEQWLDVTAKVVELWEARSDSVAQVGLLGDESGTTKFVAFESSDLPELDEGAVYRLENLVTDEYQGNFSVKLNRTTTITEVDEEIEVGDDAETVEGALVDIQSGSGLIKRCPEEGCTRVLQNGRCSEHGDVEGEFDLRIKGVLDDGETVHEVIFDRESTEALTGTTLAEAKDMAMDALDTTVVVDEMRGGVLGRYYRVSGPQFGRYVLVDEFERLSDPVDAEAALIEARSI
jgi:replication factor A1